jgi:hypothetical protein
MSKINQLEAQIEAFSAKNLVVSVSEMRIYGEKRANMPNDRSGFANLSQLSDEQITKIIGDSHSVKSARYRVSGFVGQSLSSQMAKDWAKITNNPKWKCAETQESLKLRRFQKTQITSK